MRVLPVFLTNNACFEIIYDKHLTFTKRKKGFYEQIIKHEPELVVFDQHYTTKKLIDQLKENHIKTINLCYLDPNRERCDISISPIKTELVKEKNFYEGAKYVMLGKEFYKRRSKIKRRVKKVLIYSKHKEAEELINKIVNGVNIKKTYVVNKKAGKNQISFTEELAKPLRKHDLAIVPMNHTLFECMAVGIPTIIVSSDKKEELIAKTFSNTDAAIHFGKYDEIKILKARKEFRRLCRAVAKRKSLAFVSRTIVNRDANDNIYEIFRRELGR